MRLSGDPVAERFGAHAPAVLRSNAWGGDRIPPLLGHVALSYPTGVGERVAILTFDAYVCLCVQLNEDIGAN